MKRTFSAAVLAVLFLAACVSQEGVEGGAQIAEKSASAESPSTSKSSSTSSSSIAESPSTSPSSISIEENENEQIAEQIPELDIEEFIRGRIVEAALACLGAPYRYAGTTPEGFDCSGLIYYAYQEAAGIAMPRSTVGLWTGGKPLERSKLKKGDIVVFSTVRAGASHAGIVVENSEDGIRFVHAASSGSKLGVIVSSLSETYYKTRYMGGRGYLD
jgi:cell wall-associated NlpC family hydrolase